MASTDLSELPCLGKYLSSTATEGVTFSKEGHLDASSGSKEQRGPVLFKAARVVQTSLLPLFSSQAMQFKQIYRIGMGALKTLIASCCKNVMEGYLSGSFPKGNPRNPNLNIETKT